jgi:lactate 2-monooxygenase
MDFKRLSFYEWRDLAERKLGEERFAYLTAGAGYSRTVEENYSAFDKWKFLPRILKSGSEPDTSTEIFGKRLGAPIILGPVRGMKYFHPDGELAVARVAKKMNLPLVLSNFASATIEEIGDEMGDVAHFLQLYYCDGDDILDSFLRRAEGAQYSGLLVTVDMAGHSIQYKGPKTSEHEKFGHEIYFSDPVFRSKLSEAPENNREEAVELWKKVRGTTVTWEYIKKIKKKTRLPVIVKGVLHPSDVEECVKIGLDGVVLSNHGGRSLDSAVTPMQVLPKIASNFSGRILLLIDSGFRSGMDVIKAIALGARCVLLGRSYVYPLAVGGEEGLAAYLTNVSREISSTVKALGCEKLNEIESECLMLT